MATFSADPVTGIPICDTTPTQPAGAALETRATITNAHLKNVSNPHSVTKAQVGLSAVSNALQLVAANNLSDLPSASTARSNLGLGTAATSPSTAFAASTHTHSPSDLTASVPVAKGGTGLTTITSGRLLYASATNTLSELSVGSGLTISSGTLSATGGGSGTVTSVALTLPSDLTVSGSPVTTAGTLTATWASQTANKVLAAPNGSTGTPTFRTLAVADIPALAASKITSGTFDVARIPTGIDASKIADGTVSNTEFQYLDGLTGNVQSQLNALSGGGGGGSYLPLSGGTMAGNLDMGSYYNLTNANSIQSNGSLIATGYTSFFGDGINFGWLPGYSAGEFQSLSGGVPAPMFFDATEVRFRGSGYAALATLNSDGLNVTGAFIASGQPGLTQTITFEGAVGDVHTLTFAAGILVGYTVTS